MLETLLNSQLSSSTTSPLYDSPAVPSIGHIQLSLEIKGSQSSATSCLVCSFHLLTNDFILLVSTSLESGVTWAAAFCTLFHPSQRKPEPKLTVDGPQETSKVTDSVASAQPTQLLLLDYGCFRRMMGRAQT